MATKQSTADYIVDQLGGLNVRVRKMFGEYALYCDEKVVALICDDQLYVKPTEAGKAVIGTITEGDPYPGAKPHWVVDPERWEDRDWMKELIRVTVVGLA
jgi:TfoX/Sxy family transcriptional regulator of competence genes